ncbi:t-SNARE [Yamadazyma tenuis ATCC 10573]|uniref:t-SNARE n=1 Tax=Candida tenuis (strain ATCC 10573 / BCRC 21748 / CBS 615 / JCM 9827 / NBRC 10315 / NRRL Y-1498 / VKM Y-70) TaxID=590646 RepID=G3AZ64_CANTC|nr:t-SNARE [Yamadazyma tenuis ATCC 10573]EGV66019.1 t-SNARE [Yamadazyma tenuis ATCC 10573]
MFRDRTNLYLSYRRTIPRGELNSTLSGATTRLSSDRFDSFEEEEGLIGRRRNRPQYKDDDGAIELQNIAPSIFDISKHIDDNLESIKTSTSELSSLYKKLLITSSNDKPEIEKKIEGLNYEITKKFENSYVLIKKFDFLQKNHQRLHLNYSNNEVKMIENFKKNYALKIQNSSLIFRNLQNNYIKFLRDDDYDDLNDTSFSMRTSHVNADEKQRLLLQEEETKNIENYSKQVLQETQQQLQLQRQPSDQIMAQREREISKLAMGILEISTIFKEMESLVVEQGTILDRIDYNITNTAQDVKDGNKELLKAKSYQSRTTKCKIIFLLSLVVFALFIIVVVKPHGTTKYVEKPPSDKPVSEAPVNDRPSVDRPEEDIGEHKDPDLNIPIGDSPT